ncbi:MAG: 4Fe-4S binding protein [Deferribacteraceae bacterium]|jgi:NAD-dependent dihydropyrimidine dehydrogenase PreA subunit|nr:4Fe-4S binding protein [Deferribacteraceae bacterium]
MVRKIIKIDAERCNGCSLCVTACHESAIGIKDGKAVLLRDDYCDGLGNCLPVCPTDAISFEEREALEYNEAEVMRNIARASSQLRQWPVQIKLLPLNAPYFKGADLLIAADCTAYAYGNFHNDFIKDKAILVGCPKLDDIDYSEKLTAILAGNDVKSLTVVRMQVPCCGGIEWAAKKAIEQSGKELPLKIVTITIDGAILD